MSYKFTKIIAAVAAIAAVPAFAQASTVAYGVPSPVEIVAFDVAAHNSAASSGAGIYPVRAGAFAANFDPRSLTLRFVNRSEVPATSVTFVVTSDGASRRIIDKGSFGPGVIVEHAFDGYIDSAHVSTAACEVAQVEFADGTVWHAAHTDVADDAGSQAVNPDADAAGDSLKLRRAELAKLSAEARRVIFRHLGTSI